jgi:hypothetical protein
VYAFGHRHESQPATFLQIYTNDTHVPPPDVTANHLVYKYVSGNSKPVPVAHLQQGDKLIHADGHAITIVKIASTMRNDGIYAPHTASGTIIVNNHVFSTYVTFNGQSHLTVGRQFPVMSWHTVNHIWFTPLRLWCLHGSGCMCKQHNHEGYHYWAKVALVLNDFWSQQHTLVQMIMMVPILAIFIPPFVVEQVMVKTMLSTSNCLAAVACLAATIMVATALARRLKTTQKLQSKYTKGHGKKHL